MVSCSGDENEVEITVPSSELPERATNFLKEYFYDYPISKVEKESANGLIIYEVYLEEGYEVVFNSEGYWQQVDAPYGKTIPFEIIPEPIQQTLKDRFYGYGVIEINTSGQNYHLVLSDNQGGASIDLLFNQSGEILSYGDM